MGHTACLTDGTVSAGGTCTFGTAGETTGFDNCKRGLACVGGTCQTICSASPDTCSTNHACVIYSSAPFDIDGMTGVGYCQPTCNPLTQTRDTDGAAACGSPTPASPTLGCYGGAAVFTCSPAGPAANTSEVVVANAFLNSCAPGYEPLLYQMTGSTAVICAALCEPGATSIQSPSQAAGKTGSNYTCPKKGANAPNECRFWWAVEDTSAAGWVPDKFSNTLGYCFDYPKYMYDSNGGNTPNTADPSCLTLSSTAHTFSTTQTDDIFWGCGPLL